MKRLIFLFKLIFSVFLCPLTFAEVPVEEWGFLDYEFKIYDSDGNDFAREGALSGRDMIALGLSFCLCKPGSDEWKECFEAYDLMAAAVTSDEAMAMGEKERGEFVLETLFSMCLKSYGLMEDSLVRTFKLGKYNCVTSSVVYMALCKECGIDARVQLVPGHVFVSVYVEGKKIDVECTNENGFEPGVRKEKIVNGKKTITLVPRSNYSRRRERSDRLAVSRIASNNVSHMNDADQYELAVPLELAALRLMTDSEREEERETLDKLLGNFAIETEKKLSPDDAACFLEYVMGRYGKSQYLLNEYYAYAYNSMARDYNAGRYDEALAKLDARKEYLSQKNYNNFKNQLIKAKVNDAHNFYVGLAKAGKYEEAKVFLEEQLEIYPGNKILSADLNRVKNMLK
ncbi:MAG: hypothetical protein J6Y93_01515 [Treponema sp.]|nr:hypothetical protein [Treponema sp.]